MLAALKSIPLHHSQASESCATFDVVPRCSSSSPVSDTSSYDSSDSDECPTLSADSWNVVPANCKSKDLSQVLFTKQSTVGVAFADTTDAPCLVAGWKPSAPFSSPLEYFPANAQHLRILSAAGLRPLLGSADNDSKCTTYLVERPPVVFPPVSAVSSLTSTPKLLAPPPANVPTLDEWRTLWKIWDLVTLEMIPGEMLHQKPIDLRHKCLFYIGHIPTFLDMLLSKAIGGEPTEPKHFWKIFERGIDPHVDDPDHCHNHSEVPERDEDWPVIETVMGFRDGVRARLASLYDDLQAGKRQLTRNIARTLLMTLEHEAWHVETLLYMLIQRAGTGTLPPPGFTVPPWHLLKEQWSNTPAPTSDTVILGPATLAIGHDDSEADDFSPEFEYQVHAHEFGWDNESPARTVSVGAFRASWRPVSNGEFLAFLEGPGKGKVQVPRTWESEREVKTMYGPVTMDVAREWPVLTSYDDLEVYAQWKGGRLPNEHELRLFLDTYDVGHEGGANIGFRNWHPVPATAGASQDGRGSNGGVWEWTSSKLDTHDGFVPTKLFTGYSEDFFDGVHHVVLGASYATIPRLCRRTVRNFYQHNYPYAWVSARVVYDI
ncbi:hypothetical protein CYLTODRAFT_454937 [Cylindrobasidium torrendii FP15055 ss-10]|uniref:DUF323-domain-containing protein n=1 Tax=Cylindrobasidium torrendii FP15055 ss-10 TaxID=1314674 RepID=A0A0D7BBN8_9AGAR|nr:hypothetical protein CYLTODRAFT_454937 [Cylindrobasidium torrendii FP15055 ss-10]